MPKEDIDYSNTVIYKISCKDETISDVYVGHTTNFVQRKNSHKIASYSKNVHLYNCKLYQVIRNNGGWDNWKMEIIDFSNCKNLYEARKKEQEHYVLLNATLNSVEPLPTKKPNNVISEDISTLEVKPKPKLNPKFSCEKCDFTCFKQTEFNRHIVTNKHIRLHDTQKISETSNTYICKCGKKYIHHSSLAKHKRTCDSLHVSSGETTITQKEPENIMISKEMFMELLKDNREMMKIIKSFAEKSNITNSTINTNSNNNNNNNTFNMNMFLNEKCKDAMNMKDFIDSIQLNMTDMENMNRLGYVEGMSNIFIDNLQKTDIYKRPVHCSDVKRETLYVKENNEWQRDGPDHAKMTNAVLAVEHKNVVLVNEWAKANPRCLNSNTRENDKYIRMSKIVTDGEKEGNIDKVIRKVAKSVAIEKEGHE